MYLFETVRWHELEIKIYGRDQRYIDLVAKTIEGTHVWERTIDATGGDRDLLARAWVVHEPTDEKPFLTIATDGEHCKSGNSHGESYTKFDKQGYIISG